MEDLQIPYAIVVEDDVRPTGRLQRDLASIDSELESLHAYPERFDMLLLGWRFLHSSRTAGELGPEGEVRAPQAGSGAGMRRVLGIWHGTHAYLITLRGARRLRELMRREGIGEHLDHWAGEANAVEEDMVVLAPAKQVFRTVGASTLGHGLGCFSCKYKDIMPYVLMVLALTWTCILVEAVWGLRACGASIAAAARSGVSVVSGAAGGGPAAVGSIAARTGASRLPLPG